MTATLVAVDLQERHGDHAVLRHVLVPEEDAGPYVERWNALGSTQAGRTEVVTHTITHPNRQAELDLHDLHPQPGEPALPLPAGVDGRPVGRAARQRPGDGA